MENTNACPYCGSDEGESVTIYSREFQGDEGHGGMVEHEEEACTICHGRSSATASLELPELDLDDEYRPEPMHTDRGF